MAEPQVFRSTGFQRIARIVMLFFSAFAIVTLISNATTAYLGMAGSLITAMAGSVIAVYLYTHSVPQPKPFRQEIGWALLILVLLYIASAYPATSQIFPVTFSVIGVP